jgi:hypothetical protein
MKSGILSPFSTWTARREILGGHKRTWREAEKNLRVENVSDIYAAKLLDGSSSYPQTKPLVFRTFL